MVLGFLQKKCMRMDRGVNEAESIKRKPESEQCGGRGLWEVVGAYKSLQLPTVSAASGMCDSGLTVEKRKSGNGDPPGWHTLH